MASWLNKHAEYKVTNLRHMPHQPHEEKLRVGDNRHFVKQVEKVVDYLNTASYYRPDFGDDFLDEEDEGDDQDSEEEDLEEDLDEDLDPDDPQSHSLLQLCRKSILNSLTLNRLVDAEKNVTRDSVYDLPLPKALKDFLCVSLEDVIETYDDVLGNTCDDYPGYPIDEDVDEEEDEGAERFDDFPRRVCKLDCGYLSFEPHHRRLILIKAYRQMFQLKQHDSEACTEETSQNPDKNRDIDAACLTDYNSQGCKSEPSKDDECEKRDLWFSVDQCWIKASHPNIQNCLVQFQEGKNQYPGWQPRHHFIMEYPMLCAKAVIAYMYCIEQHFPESSLWGYTEDLSSALLYLEAENILQRIGYSVSATHLYFDENGKYKRAPPKMGLGIGGLIKCRVDLQLQVCNRIQMVKCKWLGQEGGVREGAKWLSD